MDKKTGIDKLKAAILDRASEQENEIISATEIMLEKINQESQAEIEKIISAAESEAKIIRNEALSRKYALENVDERLAILESKHNYIDKVITEARERLENESDSSKLDRYLKLLPEYIEGEFIITPAKGECEIVANLIKQAGFQKQAKINSEEGKFKGGFILTAEEFILDKSYINIFREKSAYLRRVAAEQLFAEFGKDSNTKKTKVK